MWEHPPLGDGTICLGFCLYVLLGDGLVIIGGVINAHARWFYRQGAYYAP